MESKVAERVRAQRWYLRFPRAVPVGIFLLVSAITGLGVYAIEQVENQRAEAQHRQVASSVSSAIERFANANAVYLRAGAALLSTRQDVDRMVFHEFAVQLENDSTLRGGGALGWAVMVPRAGIPALEQQMRGAGGKGFAVHPLPTGETAMPVVFIEPGNAGRSQALGFDMYSEPARREAVERAVRSGRPTASGLITLQSEPGGGAHTGIGIFMPVYAGPPEHRRLHGVIARAFNAQGFLDVALAPEQFKDYGVELYDAESPVHVAIAALGPQAARNRRMVRSIMIADHRMDVEISPPSGSTLSNLSLLTLLFGMMVAALLLVVARLVTHQASEDRIALAWFEEQASIRNSLTRELNHRVKNTLANVLSIVALTRRRTDSIDDFVTALIGRVRALSATHDLLTQSEWGTTPIHDVVSAELAPYAQGGDQAVLLRGPRVELAPNDALSLGLAVHELATNATKYGALSTPAGRVEVSWEMITDKLVRVDWAEHGGPPVPELRRRGFGTELIEKIVAHELKNPVDLRFGADGVRCTLIVPVRPAAQFQLRESRDGTA